MDTYFRLELQRMRRNLRYMFFTALYPVIIYLFFSNVGNSDSSKPGGDLVAGVHVQAYIMVSMAVFGACGAAIAISGFISQEREQGWTRQLRLTPLPPWCYVTSKIVNGLLVALLSVFLVFIAGAAVNGVDLSAGRWLESYGLLFLGVLPFTALGVFLGYLATGPAGRPVMIFTWMGLSLFGGLWVPVTQLPDVMANIAHALPSYQMANLAWKTLADQAPTVGGIAVLLVWTLVFIGLAAWRYRRDALRPA
jgi:ABC-2 type transport system permease protein